MLEKRNFNEDYVKNPRSVALKCAFGSFEGLCSALVAPSPCIVTMRLGSLTAVRLRLCEFPAASAVEKVLPAMAERRLDRRKGVICCQEPMVLHNPKVRTEQGL